MNRGDRVDVMFSVSERQVQQVSGKKLEMEVKLRLLFESLGIEIDEVNVKIRPKIEDEGGDVFDYQGA